jgi:hypothetical protein
MFGNLENVLRRVIKEVLSWKYIPQTRLLFLAITFSGDSNEVPRILLLTLA